MKFLTIINPSYRNNPNFNHKYKIDNRIIYSCSRDKFLDMSLCSLIDEIRHSVFDQIESFYENF
jgi:hypothetical protein